MKPWRMRVNRYARAFVQPPTNPLAALYLWWRGYKPFNAYWWSKPSPNQRKLDRQIWEQSGTGNWF